MITLSAIYFITCLDLFRIYVLSDHMYIRKTKTADHGEGSYTYRIVESVRVGE
jgi:hypothetical protein